VSGPLVVKTEDWPHGLRCMECNRELVEGDQYSERLSGFVDDTPAVHIICAECAVAGATGQEGASRG